ncbi:MAG: type II secretion system minor pseudopilin GspK [Woeseiaceae bacterium]|nr:type II secretion system minor pseudopilin GspK [Woeseiaceae bacterium]
MRRHARQRGVALITAILIVALIGSLSAALTWDSGLHVHRTMSMMFHDEGTQAAFGAESWVMSLLRDDLADSNTDHLGEFWAQDLPVLPIESDTIQGTLFGELEDLQGRFNINNLVDGSGVVDEEALAQFQRLLTVLDVDPRLAGIAADWIDADLDAGFPDGAEDPIYTGFVPPYRAPNLQITTITELAALDGMDKSTFDILAPHITALPRGTKINVNTATAAVLQSLDENLSPGDVESLIAEREDSGFENVENTFSSLVAPEVVEELVDTSNYFQLKVVVQIATVRITYFSILQRGSRGDVVPIQRSFGTI